MKMTLARRVFGATALITLAGLFSRLVGFAAAPLLTRLVGPEGYGVFALAGTVGGIGTTLSLLGLENAYTRYYLKVEGEERFALERLVWRIAFGSAVLVSMAAAATWFLVGEPAAARTPLLAILTGLLVGLNSLGIMGQTRARLLGRYGLVALAIAVSGGLSTLVAVAVGYLLPGNSLALFAGAVTLMLLTLLMLRPPGRRELRGPVLPLKAGWAAIRLGLFSVITAPMYWIITAADRWILAAYRGEAEVGVYGVAFSLATVGMLLNSALMLTWFPEASRAYEEDPAGSAGNLGRLWTRMVGVLMVLWVAVAAAGGDLLRIMAAPAFHTGAVTIPWVAGGMFWYGLASLALTGLMLKMSMRPAVFGWVLGAALNLGANLLLIPRLGALGAGIANCLGLALVGILLTAAAQRRFPMQIQWLRLTLCGAICVGLGAAMAPAWGGSPLVSLLLKLPLGMAGALAVAILLAPDWLRYGWDLVRSGLSKPPGA